MPVLQVCDGVPDCPEGEDEEGGLCSGWRCEGDSVRCQEDNICISPPSASLCSGQFISLFIVKHFSWFLYLQLD